MGESWQWWVGASNGQYMYTAPEGGEAVLAELSKSPEMIQSMDHRTSTVLNGIYSDFFRPASERRMVGSPHHGTNGYSWCS